MALPSTVYRVTIQLSDVDRGVYETIQTTVARHPSETEERLIARLLAYLLFFEPELVFSRGISATDEPDIWVKGPDGRVLLWVEVGLPEAERIIKASRHAERTALIVCGRTVQLWEQQHLPKLETIQNLSVISFDQTFITCLTARLDRSISWDATISDGILYVNIGKETFETTFNVRSGKR
jgi:uncharacterized protein YaeQ